MAEFKSYKNKVVDFGIKSDSFKNENGENINYKQLVVKVNLDGDVEDIVLSGKNVPAPKILQSIFAGANDQTNKSLLDN